MQKNGSFLQECWIEERDNLPLRA